MVTSILDEPLVIRASAAKSFLFAVLGVLMATACGAMALGYFSDEPWDFYVLIGWIGLIFFGASTVMWLRQGLGGKRTVLTMDRNGLHDLRVTRLPIPWTAIEDVNTWSMNGQNVLVVEVPPETEAAIGLSRMARMSRGMNARLGADGLCITAAGLQISYPDLYNAVVQRAITARTEQQNAKAEHRTASYVA